MTHLRQMMLEELQRRNYAQNTAKTYLRIVRDFAQHYHTAPDLLGPDQIREYSAYLFNDRKLEAGTVEQHVAGSKRHGVNRQEIGIMNGCLRHN